jgi:hypothetical protein
MRDEDERRDDELPSDDPDHEAIGPGTTAGGGATRAGRRVEPERPEDAEDEDA